MADSYILALVNYALDNQLIEKEDYTYAVNAVLEVMQLDSIDLSVQPAETDSLEEILNYLIQNGVKRGIVDDNFTAYDLFDTKLMGAFTPFPSQVRKTFSSLYKEDSEKATDWYYNFSKATNYIRTERVARDKKWIYDCEYGQLDITINLSKPEKDPRAIAAAKNAPQSDYPKCQLCAENEGYAGRMNHPARQNHRIIPVTINNSDWFFQYSPYVYYNEHCIVFNGQHIPMKIEKATFGKLLDFVKQFPHYFVGSNADLPIVGGSILSHDHFQGGNYTFTMAKAGIEKEIAFKGFEDVQAGIVKWPMSVIRLSSPDTDRLIELADKILLAWREYTDEAAFVYAYTDGVPHNTITPIARKKGDNFELDLVLRNNITTDDRPLGVYHPNPTLHHIKKENIGLIEVMGLAVLPGRLNKELAQLKDAILAGADIRGDEALSVHADWIDELKAQYTFDENNTEEILKQEVGKVFKQVLEDAGVYKCTEEGREAFMRFVDTVNK